jgi:Saccharopine dehydrogenase NADP binding domain
LSTTDVDSACRTLESAKSLAAGFSNAHPISLDVTDPEALDTAVAKVDLVISLIPYTFHAAVINSAIRNKKTVVTTSYVSSSMLELEKEVKEAGITVTNEIASTLALTTSTVSRPLRRLTRLAAKSHHSCPIVAVPRHPKLRTIHSATNSPARVVVSY